MGSVKNYKRQNLNKEVLPMLLSGSPIGKIGTFCISNETEKVYQELEEVIGLFIMHSPSLLYVMNPPYLFKLTKIINLIIIDGVWLVFLKYHKAP